MGRYHYREIWVASYVNPKSHSGVLATCSIDIFYCQWNLQRHSYRHGWVVGRVQRPRSRVGIVLYIEVLDTPNSDQLSFLYIRIHVLIQKAKDIITLFLHRKRLMRSRSPISIYILRARTFEPL